MLFEEVASCYEKLESVSSRLSMIDILTELLKKSDEDEIRHLIYMTQGFLAPPFENVEIGIAEKLAEEAIAIATGSDKEKSPRTSRRRATSATLLKKWQRNRGS